MIADASQRAAALDTAVSFCVSAPAGSGKTELLIQRYLALLTRVQRPEQILAITFTRKAAAEMRQRIVGALIAARDQQPCGSEHEATTRALSSAVLAHDENQKWQLLDNVVRLNVKTIDSFCASLTRQMPVLSSFGGQASVTEDAGELYIEAVQSLFTELDSAHAESSDLKALLLHFDNNWDRLQELLVAMLARRDQWRDYLGVHHSPDESEDYLRQVVDLLVTDSLQSLSRMLRPHTGTLLEMLQYQASNSDKAAPDVFPAPRPGDLSIWRQVAAMLLTAGGTWRLKIDKSMGFPAGKGSANEQRERLAELIAELREIEGLEVSLNELAFLPQIGEDNPAWLLVLHLSRVLPLLAAKLLLVFQRHGLVDHSQVAMSALTALGDDEQPTDLALRLDYTIDHVLVDEFQDTAISQFELVRRLTRGWLEHNEAHPANPRTLMIVGDGMQSIYGFRDANVSLFLKARDEGFNGLPLRFLQLSCNFRSRGGVVEWINDTFEQAFPRHDDIGRGRVAFTRAESVKPADESVPVSMHAFRGDNAELAEAAFICDQVAEALLLPDCQSIAVLGRTRNQLRPLLAALRDRGIAYAAQDIDSLADAPVIVDLMILCRALANRYDRLAWLALLRAPWCGLFLNDLLRVARWGDDSKYSVVADVLQDPALADSLSPDGSERLRSMAGAMAWAEHNRDRLALRVWIEQLWLRLAGPMIPVSPVALADAEQFFQLLERADREGQGLNVSWLEHQVDRLYAHPGAVDATVQVMTLHKAKGLEFDWVIIPDLARTPRSDSRNLLLWDEHTRESGEREFLLAADDHSADGEPSLYNYLRAERKRKSLLENTRLLYVGATRAVQRLVLTARPSYDERKQAFKKPGNTTLLAPIWSTFESAMSEHDSPMTASAGVRDGDSDNSAPKLQRLRSLDTASSVDAPGREPIDPCNIPDDRLNRVDRHVGTAVHRLLEALALSPELPAGCGQAEKTLCLFTLRQLGLGEDVLEEATERVLRAVNATLADDRHGRWLLASDHPEAACELPLTCVDNTGRITNLVIDRTFIDASTGNRWVIDYKTSRPADGEALDAFLAREEVAYRGQLASYGAAISALGDEPVTTALYFAGLGHLHLVPAI